MLAKNIQFVLLAGISICTLQSNAQNIGHYTFMQGTEGSRALNFQIGTTTFLGDLGGNKGAGKPFIKDYNSKTIRPLAGISYSYYPKSWLSLTGGLNFTWVAGADSLIKTKVGNAMGRYERNLSFKSSIIEASVGAEVYPFQNMFHYDKARFRPFVGLGVGLFYFNPKAALNGKWIKLRPLHLEGQGFAEYPERKEYKLLQPYFPLAIGAKYRLNNNYFLALSATFRRTFTDYIDDVSTTYINPDLFDKYLSPNDAIIAKQLYYRGNNAEAGLAGPYRGYASKDSYTSVSLSITYFFNRDNY